MKKAIKVTLLIAVGMVVMGMGMVFVSLASTGFHPEEWLNTREYVEKTYDISEEFTDMDLDIGTHGIIICKADDGDAHFVCYETDKEFFEVGVENGVLKIGQKSNYSWTDNIMVINDPEPNKLYLPKEEYDNLTVSVGSGDFEAKTGLKLDDIEVKVGSGDVEIENITMKNLYARSGSGKIAIAKSDAKSATLETASGSITVNGMEVKETVSAKCSSGSLYFDDITCNSVNIKSGSGSVTANNIKCEESFEGNISSGSFKMNEVVADGEFKARTGSGSIKFESCDGKSMNLQTSSGSIKGSVKTVKKFNATAGSGDIKVPQDDPNGGECVLHTGSGDISITYANAK